MAGSRKRPHPVDVLIVGGGSAGCVLAARLSTRPRRSVRLLEAGDAYPLDSVPADLLDPAHVPGDPDHDWGYTMRGSAGNPRAPAPRGKALGGSSAVNATIAMRAAPDDIRRWNRHGLHGWSVEEVMATFKAMENAPDGDPRLHGHGGPFPIRQRSYGDLTPSLRAFIDAAAAAGYARIEDFCGERREGIGEFPVNVIEGRRQNAAMTYLSDAVRVRSNLTIDAGVMVDRVLFEPVPSEHGVAGAARAIATGVVDADGRVFRAREVILAAGAYGSAAILLRSGVGPQEDLSELGIAVVADLPVGRRLVDHPHYYNVYALKPGFLDIDPPAGALLWTASSEARGDELDLHVTATHLVDHSLSPTGAAIVLGTSVVAPDARGTLRLRSRDPGDQPDIDSNFLGEQRDRTRMLEGAKLSRELGRSPQLAAVLEAELQPGAGVRDDATLADSIDRTVVTYAHPASTVPMGGPDDPWAVVDSCGVVKGLSGLRVIDASIMPEIPTVAINLTVIMIAERLVQLVYGAGAS